MGVISMATELITEQSKAVVRRLHEEVFVKGDVNAVDEIVAEDFVLHEPDGDHGREEHFKGMVPAFRAAFPDLQFTFEDMIAEGDTVATRFTMHGTHEGEFMGIPPTGKEVRVSGMVFERVEDGKVQEGWVQRDNLGMMQQLGVIPHPEQPEEAGLT